LDYSLLFLGFGFTPAVEKGFFSSLKAMGMDTFFDLGKILLWYILGTGSGNNDITKKERMGTLCCQLYYVARIEHRWTLIPRYPAMFF